MLDFPFEVGLIIYLALASLALALLTLLVLLINRVRRTVHRARGKMVKHISIAQHSLRFIFTIIWILLSTTILFLSAFVQSYKSFTREELAAEIRCEPITGNGARQSMQLTFTPVRDGVRGEPREFTLNGDQWAVEGHIIKWDNWLNFAGLHTMYKLTRIKGRYLRLEEERNRPPSVYSLVEREEEPPWRWLYEYGHRLRFVTAVYGNTVYTYPSKNRVFQIYVTTSGLTVKIK